MSAMSKEKKGLSAESIDALLTKAFALTHKIHALDKIKSGYAKGGEQRQQVEDDAQELRNDRDLIVREIKRRTGDL